MLEPAVYCVFALHSTIVSEVVSLRVFTLSNFIVVSNCLILLLTNCAYALACVVTDEPPPPVIVTVGVDVYPTPTFVTFILVILI